MKKNYFFLFLLLSACSGSDKADSQNESNSLTGKSAGAPVDQKNGFRDHRFGDDISTFSDLELTEQQRTYGGDLKVGGDAQVYERPDAKENLKIGDTPLDFIWYAFYKGKFWYVEIQPAGKHPMEVLTALNSLYGASDTTSVERANFSWTGDREEDSYWWTGKKATATLQKNWVGNRILLAIESREIRKQIEDDMAVQEKQAGRRAATDL